MHIITRKALDQFVVRHPETKSALNHWYRLMKTNTFGSFKEPRAIFASADRVNELTVFNIGGNKTRRIASIHYNRGKVYIRDILTHPEYDHGKWKE